MLSTSFQTPIQAMKERAWKNLAALKFLSKQRIRRSSWIQQAWSHIVPTR
jgi:hypothetical protein